MYGWDICMEELTNRPWIVAQKKAMLADTLLNTDSLRNG